MRINYFWMVMYIIFKIRRQPPKDLFDFDEVYYISDIAKKELNKK